MPYCIHILLSLHIGVLVFTGNSPTQIWFPLSICINKHQRTCLSIPKCYRGLPGCLTLTLGLGYIGNICITVRKHELILIIVWLINWHLGKWLSFWKCYLNLQIWNQLTSISFKFCMAGLLGFIDDRLSLIHVMTWCRWWNRSCVEPMMTKMFDIIL